MHSSTPTNAVPCVEKSSVGGAITYIKNCMCPSAGDGVSYLSWSLLRPTVRSTPPRKEAGLSPSKVVSRPAALVLYRHTGDPVSGDSYSYNLVILCSTGGCCLRCAQDSRLLTYIHAMVNYHRQHIKVCISMHRCPGMERKTSEE